LNAKTLSKVGLNSCNTKDSFTINSGREHLFRVGDQGSNLGIRKQNNLHGPHHFGIRRY
jgi:hypothetical protein